MTLADIEKLEARALRQSGLEVGTPIAVTPFQLVELCRLAKIGQAAEATAGKPL